MDERTEFGSSFSPSISLVLSTSSVSTRKDQQTSELLEIVFPMRPLGNLPNVVFISAIHTEIIGSIRRKVEYSPHLLRIK